MTVPMERARAGLAAVRAENGVELDFPAEVVAEAERAVAAYVPPEVDLTALELVTLDPAGSTDLDQAFHIEAMADGAGFRVRYAIADVPAFVDARRLARRRDPPSRRDGLLPGPEGLAASAGPGRRRRQPAPRRGAGRVRVDLRRGPGRPRHLRVAAASGGALPRQARLRRRAGTARRWGAASSDRPAARGRRAPAGPGGRARGDQPAQSRPGGPRGRRAAGSRWSIGPRCRSRSGTRSCR